MIKRISRVGGQEDRATFLQVNEERLMSGSVAWGEDHFHRAIAKQVIVIRRGSLQEMPRQAGTIKILPDIAAAREPIRRESVFVLRALNDMERFRKTPGGASVIEVQMREQNVRN